MEGTVNEGKPLLQSEGIIQTDGKSVFKNKHFYHEKSLLCTPLDIHIISKQIFGQVACNQPAYKIDVSDVRQSISQQFGFWTLTQTCFR